MHQPIHLAQPMSLGMYQGLASSMIEHLILKSEIF
jgi:hypothetical protein